MSRIEPQPVLIGSLLDRLIDPDPTTRTEPPRSAGQSLRELKHSVRRDLENLLNTRGRFMPLPSGLGELTASLANYGIPDFAALPMGGREDRDRFRLMIERAIQRYEPRFKSVTVTLLDKEEPLDRTLRFRIDALLHAEPLPEPVVFDSILEPTTRQFQVQRPRR